MLIRPARRYGLATVAALAGLVVSASLAVGLVSADEAPAPVPSRYADAKDRMLAAVDDLHHEEQRIAAAQSAFDSELAVTPNAEMNYLVSLATPQPAATLLGLVEKEGVKLDVVYTWLLAPGSDQPIVGEQSMAYFAAASFAEIAGNLRDAALAYVERSLAGLEVDDAKKRAELESLRDHLKAEGALIYGFRCVCPPEKLQALVSHPDIVLRAVESETDQQFPIPPADPLRDLIIESGGTYGR